MNASLRTDDVMRYQDARFKTIAAKLLPTQYLVVDDTTALTTTLGSCVAACLRDPVLKIGGMNHFMLPDGAGNGVDSGRYGSYAMELLINDVLKAGGRRERLEAKLEQYPGQLTRACVELAKDWRTDRYLRRLEAMNAARSSAEIRQQLPSLAATNSPE